MRLQWERVSLNQVADIYQGDSTSLRDVRLYMQNKLKFHPDEAMKLARHITENVPEGSSEPVLFDEDREISISDFVKKITQMATLDGDEKEYSVFSKAAYICPMIVL